MVNIMRGEFLISLITEIRKKCFNKCYKYYIFFNLKFINDLNKTWTLHQCWLCQVALYVNVMALLLSIDLIQVQKISSKYRCLAKCSPESLHNCHRCLVWPISIINMDVSMYMFTQHSPILQLPGQPCLGLQCIKSPCP